MSQDLMQMIARWQMKQFGFLPERAGTLKHLEKEIDEIKSDSSDPDEWTDIVFLGIQGLWKTLREKYPHLNEDDITNVMLFSVAQKLTINLARMWPAADPTRPVEHVRTAAEEARKNSETASAGSRYEPQGE